MGEFISICKGDKVFSLEKANELLPIIRRICQQYSTVVDRLVHQLSHQGHKDRDKIEEIEESIEHNIQAWNRKIKQLGVHPKGLWIVDFDSGDGYFCWKYPEPIILYWHGYNDGFSKRISITEWGRQFHQEAEPPVLENP